MLLLALVGVAPEEIAADYELSAERLRARYAARGEEDQGPLRPGPGCPVAGSGPHGTSGTPSDSPAPASVYLDSAPLVARGTAYVGSGSGRVYGLDLRTGRVRWRGDAGAPVRAPVEAGFVAGLAAAEGLLLVPAYRRLVAFG